LKIRSKTIFQVICCDHHSQCLCSSVETGYMLLRCYLYYESCHHRWQQLLIQWNGWCKSHIAVGSVYNYFEQILLCASKPAALYTFATRRHICTMFKLLMCCRPTNIFVLANSRCSGMYNMSLSKICSDLLSENGVLACLCNFRFLNENTNSLWLRGWWCMGLLSWFTMVGPGSGSNEYYFLCNVSALICCQILGKHVGMYQKRFCKHVDNVLLFWYSAKLFLFFQKSKAFAKKLL